MLDGEHKRDKPGPRLVVAGVRSGAGKTSVTAALVCALRRRGLVVQTFKAGPDYIDPGFLTALTGRACRNLDTYLLDPEVVLELFRRACSGADIAVVEGVMGLFDGAGGIDERGSTAHLAKILDAPVLVVLDAAKAARSVAAVAYGCVHFDAEVSVRGFILNYTGSRRHEGMIRSAVEDRPGLPVLGAFDRGSLPELASRHLGLVPAWERTDLPADQLAEAAETSLDVSAVIRLAETASESTYSAKGVDGGQEGRRQRVFVPGESVATDGRAVGIAYALDRAFHFYYQDNLDYLEHIGARLVPFSPLSDRSLPENVGAIYFGGGYPELAAAELAANTEMIAAVRNASEDGMPILAECGGLMYLARELVDAERAVHRQVGVFEMAIAMRRRLAALGYYTAEVSTEIPWVPSVGRLVGHVYHWSEIVENDHEPVFRLHSPEKPELSDGFLVRCTLASYLHVHFASCPELAAGFVEAARRFVGRKESVR